MPLVHEVFEDAVHDGKRSGKGAKRDGASAKGDGDANRTDVSSLRGPRAC